jgi:hypothetical protein
MASAITTTFGSGGANLTPSAAGTPTLAGALRDIADDIADVNAGPVPAWVAGVTVTTNVAVRVAASWIISVHVTAGGVTGIINILSTGTPATKQCTVTYAAGVATLTFAAGDAVTAISILEIPKVAGLSARLTKA